MRLPHLQDDIPLYMAPPSTEALRKQMRAGSLGAIITPASGNALEEGIWWCADNAVFGGRYPGDEPYLRWLAKLRPFAPWCLFAVAPDVVADAYATCNRSYPLLERIRELGFPVALVAQDFMESCPHWDWNHFDVLFVGGSTAWKLSPAAANLCRVANSIGKHVHVGRVNGLRRYSLTALLHCAGSVDGTGTTNAPDEVLADILWWRTALRREALSIDPLLHDPWDGGYNTGDARPFPAGAPVPSRPNATPLTLFDVPEAAGESSHLSALVPLHARPTGLTAPIAHPSTINMPSLVK